MSEVTFKEKTEVEGVFCPILKGACRLDCSMLINVDDGCAVRGIYDTLQRIGEQLDEWDDRYLGWKRKKIGANPYTD